MQSSTGFFPRIEMRMSFVFVLMVAPLWAQSTAVRPPEFEVASVKPAPALDARQLVMGTQRAGIQVDSARLDIANLSLADIIRIAFRVKPYQIAGPDWMRQQRFDILGKLPDGASSDQAPEMLQELLAKRFRLAVHREVKEHDIYVLVVGKNGPKLVESPGAPVPGPASGTMQLSTDAGNLLAAGETAGPIRLSMGPGGAMRLEAPGATIAALAGMLSRILDRPVVDMTALKGAYRLSLNLSAQDLHAMVEAAGLMPPGQAGDMHAPAGPSGSDTSPVFEAIQQLGLRLESRKAPVETIVIDRLEKTPTEN